MGAFLGYRCSGCRREFRPDEVSYNCPEDGANLDVLIDHGRIAQATSPAEIAASAEASIWRYLPLLPVADPGLRATPMREVGCTPLLRPARLNAALGLDDLWLKDDGRNPTASFKDRASAVVVARAREIGAETVVTASTGNAGAALAGMAAASGLPAVILAPKNAPPAKIAQLLIFGARVFLVEGSYDDAFDLSLEAAQAFGWYCRNTGFNPFTAEGKKTAAFEICEQLSAPAAGGTGSERWEVPDAVFVPVGDGNIISGVHKGFADLLELGWIERLPRLFGVQAAGSAAVARAFQSGAQTIQPVRSDTLADSISVDLPRDGMRALRAVRQTGGGFLIVEDAQILEAIARLGREAAIFAEPAGAAGLAGLIKALGQGLIGAGERVVVMVTGNGLKDVSAGMQAAGQALVIRPTLDALREAWGQGS